MLTSLIFFFSHILLPRNFYFHFHFHFHFTFVSLVFTCIYILLLSHTLTRSSCAAIRQLFIRFTFISSKWFLIFFFSFCIFSMLLLLLLLYAGELKTCCWQCLMSSQPQDVHIPIHTRIHTHTQRQTYIFIYIYLYKELYFSIIHRHIHTRSMQVLCTQGTTQLLSILPTQIHSHIYFCSGNGTDMFAA